MDRIDQSVANLLNIIKEQDKQIQLLADLLFILIKGGIQLIETSVIPIQSINNLLEYLNEYDIDYLVLIIPDSYPRAYDREELDKARENGTLELFIREQWKQDTIALAI